VVLEVSEGNHSKRGEVRGFETSELLKVVIVEVLSAFNFKPTGSVKVNDS
jgi:hypothetical protein